MGLQGPALGASASLQVRARGAMGVWGVLANPGSVRCMSEMVSTAVEVRPRGARISRRQQLGRLGSRGSYWADGA